MRSRFVVALLIAALPAGAHAAPFVNGGFEQGPAVGAGFAIVGSGDGTTIPGWVVTAGSIDHIGAFWQAHSGTRSIDLNGASQGALQQTFDTIAGQTYSVTFALAGNPDGGPSVKTVLTTATGGAVQTSTFDTTGNNRANMGWRTYAYSFSAGGTSTTLSFASADAGAHGAALDSVTVSAVPEPAIWAMMVFGFFGLSFAVRRRDPRPKARVRFT